MGYERQWCNELKFLNSNFFPVLFVCICKCRCWSTCLCLHFYHEMLGSLHHTSMDTSVLWLLVVSPLLFPFLNLVFQKVFFLQRSLLEMKLNEIYSFFFFEQLYVIISHSNVLVHSNSNNDKISKIWRFEQGLWWHLESMNL